MQKKTSITASLIALILAGAGGSVFLHGHPNPKLRDVFLACERGQISGLACCEDMGQVTDWLDKEKVMEKCSPVTPKNHDPLGVREKEQDDWDAKLKLERNGQ